MESADPSIEAVLEAATAAYNAHDVDAYVSLFTPAATFSQLGGRTLLDNRDAMKGYYRQLFDTRPTIQCAILQRTVMGPFGVELQEISGEGHAGMQAMVISEVRDGRILRVWYTPLAGGSPH